MKNNNHTANDYVATVKNPTLVLEKSEYATPQYPIDSWDLFEKSPDYETYEKDYVDEEDSDEWIDHIIQSLGLKVDIDYLPSDELSGVTLTPWAALRIMTTFSDDCTVESYYQMAKVMPLPLSITPPIPKDFENLLFEHEALKLAFLPVQKKEGEKRKAFEELRDQCVNLRKELRSLSCEVASENIQKLMINLGFTEKFKAEAEADYLSYQEFSRGLRGYIIRRLRMIERLQEFDVARYSDCLR